ncbi:hypothetical protein [Frankia sp. CiP3]|uniref:hypothetical protein n=1 Tax=Frankia sp. CiP3 TaxID=2880971 RepID=UPI001EF50B48|nr:hypothetical protein [Frankia sp. CiP3]
MSLSMAVVYVYVDRADACFGRMRARRPGTRARDRQEAARAGVRPPAAHVVNRHAGF